MHIILSDQTDSDPLILLSDADAFLIPVSLYSNLHASNVWRLTWITDRTDEKRFPRFCWVCSLLTVEISSPCLPGQLCDHSTPARGGFYNSLAVSSDICQQAGQWGNLDWTSAELKAFSVKLEKPLGMTQDINFTMILNIGLELQISTDTIKEIRFVCLLLFLEGVNKNLFAAINVVDH